jgi:DNA-binding GntR family transcriptional regulator
MIFDHDEPGLTDRFQTAAQFAYLHLRGMIIGGELPGGSRLNQEELAARLELSRMPIRQAIERLESEGLVTIRRSRGAVVTSLDAAGILELFEIRSVLEGLAFKFAVSAIDAQETENLERQVHALELAQSDVTNWLVLHERFHNSLCQYAARPRLAEQIRLARLAVTPYIRLYLATHDDAELSGFKHGDLLDAARGGDPVVCERIMREHIMSVAHEVAKLGSNSSKTQQPSTLFL